MGFRYLLLGADTAMRVKMKEPQGVLSFNSRNSNIMCIFPQTVAVAEQFNEASKCVFCMCYPDKPTRLNCGFIRCLRCISSLQKDPSGEGVSWPSCSVVTQKNDIWPDYRLGKLVSKIKELEPQLRAILYQSPRMWKFQGGNLCNLLSAHQWPWKKQLLCPLSISSHLWA